MSASQRKVPVLIVIGLALVASGAGAWAIDTQRFTTNVNEPVTIQDPTNWGADIQLTPGDTVTSSVDLTSQNDSQTVVLRLRHWNDSLNQSGVMGARNGSGGYVSEMSVGDARLTFDLLNDGTANYHFLDADETVNNSFSLTVPTDTAAGDVSYTIAYARGETTAGSDLVKMHRSQGVASTCGSCHSRVDSSASISRAHETMGIANQSCTDCHRASLVDIHMDCTSGCHDSYPIDRHGPEQNLTVTADYRCGADCHGDQQELAHQYLTNGTCQTCHGSTDSNDSTGSPDTLMTIHDSLGGKLCVNCHGLGSPGIHRPYSGDDCGACHGGGGGWSLESTHDAVTDCPTCHGTDDGPLVHDGTTASCAACHSGGTVSHPTKDRSKEITGITRCETCHRNDRDPENHASYLCARNSPIDCTQCHGSSSPRRERETVSKAIESAVVG